jgi:hypothetical protein
MTVSTFEQVLARLTAEDLFCVIIAGYREPTTHPKFDEFVEAMRGRHLRFHPPIMTGRSHEHVACPRKGPWREDQGASLTSQDMGFLSGVSDFAGSGDPTSATRIC